MRKILLFASGIALLMSCDSGITGKGNIVSEKREVSSFSVIRSHAVAEIVFTQDSSLSIEVKGYENLLPLLITRVEDGILTIETKENIRMVGKQHLQVFIHVPSLSKLELTGVGSISSDGNFNFGNVSVNLSGVGSIDLTGHAGKAILLNSGAGSIQCKHLQTDTVVASNSGVGSIV